MTTLSTMVTLRAVSAALNQHDPVAVAAAYAENATLRLTGGTTIEGRAAIEGYYRTFFTTFPDLSFELTRVLNPNPQTQVLEYTLSGTHLGPITVAGKEYAPTGLTFKNEYVSTITFDTAGQATSQVVVGDSLAMLRQLRIIPPLHTTKEARIEKVRQFINALNERDIEAVMACFTPEAVVGTINMGHHHGREAIQRMWENAFKAYPTGKLTITSLLADDTTVVAAGTLQLVNSGDFTFRKGTGNTVNLEYTYVCEVGPAGIFALRSYSDGLSWATQLGFVKQ